MKNFLNVVFFILFLFSALNPEVDSHRRHFVKQISTIEDEDSKENIISNKYAEGWAYSNIYRDNYLIFSISKIQIKGEIYSYALGFFGFVLPLKNNISDSYSQFLTSKNNSENTTNLTDDDLSINRAVNALTYLPEGNIYIMSRDLEGDLYYNDTLDSCKNFGAGWRLPTSNELILISKNRNIISGLNENGIYMTSELVVDSTATYKEVIVVNFSDNSIGWNYSDRGPGLKVRLVKNG